MKEKQVLIRGYTSIEELQDGKHYFLMDRAEAINILLALNEFNPMIEMEMEEFKRLRFLFKTFIVKEWG